MLSGALNASELRSYIGQSAKLSRLRHPSALLVETIEARFGMKKVHPSRWTYQKTRPERNVWVVDKARIPRKGITSAKTRTKELASVKAALAAARWMLAPAPDVEVEGFTPCSKDTWDRMESFLTRHTREFLRSFRKVIPAPEILPGPKGSIDILWKSPLCELLVNIPTDPSKPATFYGDDKESMTIKGHLDPSRPNPGLLAWLMRYQTLAPT